jgi:hypothetical protein
MKKVKAGKSKIHGNGLIADEPIRRGEVIELVHTIREIEPGVKKTTPTLLGRNYNHSEEPNSMNVIDGNNRYLVALKEIEVGGEITTDYRNNPDLEQPDSFTSNDNYISFDYDDTLTTPEGFKLAKQMVKDGNNLYVITARDKMSPQMIERAEAAGIPKENIILAGSDEQKVKIVKDNNISKHIDNKESVIKALGKTGELFAPDKYPDLKADFVEMDLSDEDLNQLKKGGFIIDQYPDGGQTKRKRERFVPGTYNPNETAGYELTEEEVTVPVKASGWGKAINDYEKNNSEEDFIEKKKKQFLKKNKGLNELYGVDMQNFPKDVEANFRNEYDYKRNTAVVKKVGKQEGWNPNKRTDYVDDLNDTQRGIVAESKYGSKLQPTYWSRTLAGLGTLASKFSPEVRDAMNKGYMPGLTQKESQEILNSKMTKIPFTDVNLPFAIPTGGLESLAGLEIPGVLPANIVKNIGLTTGSDYKEMPSWYNGEKMANVKDKDVTASNLLSYAGLEAIPELGVNALKSGYNALKASKEAGLLSNTYKLNPFANKLNEYNRVVGQDAILDLQNSGLVRSGERGGVETNMGVRTSAYPSFGKGIPGQRYIDQTIQQGKTPYIISTDRPMGVSTLGRHGKGSTMLPIDETGKYMSAFSADEAKVFGVKPNWLTGYKEIPKELPSSSDLNFYRTRGKSGEGTSTGLGDVDIQRAIDRNKEWITSAEYAKRRAANTGESLEEIQKSVDKIIKNADNATYKLNTNSKKMDLYNAEGTMSSKKWYRPAKIEISSKADNPLQTLDHEVTHLYSPAIFDDRKIYKNYPEIGVEDYYLSKGQEQQVRHLNAREQILKENNLPMDAQLSEEQVTDFINDWRSRMNNRKKNKDDISLQEDYDDLWSEKAKLIQKEMLKAKYNTEDLNFIDELPTVQKIRFMNAYVDRFSKAVTSALNNAWMTVPIAGGMGISNSITPEQKYGGSINKLNRFIR